MYITMQEFQDDMPEAVKAMLGDLVTAQVLSAEEHLYSQESRAALLKKRAGNVESLTVGRCEIALTDATGRVDHILGQHGHYVVPLENPNEDIKALVRAIATWKLIAEHRSQRSSHQSDYEAAAANALEAVKLAGRTGEAVYQDIAEETQAEADPDPTDTKTE